MKLHTCFIKGLLSASLIAVAVGLAAQTEPEGTRVLILNTEPEPTPIELKGSLQINAQGNMEATPLNPKACTVDPDDIPECEDPPDCDCECDELPDCEDLDVQVDPPTFRVNGSTSATVQEGTAVSFSWNSRGAWSCDAAGDLPNWNATGLLPRSADIPSDQLSVNTANLAGDSPYEATLVCSNGPVSRTESVTITVNESDEQLPDICSEPSRQMPSPTWTRMESSLLSCSYTQGGNQVFSADCTTWEGIWGGSFMDVTGISLRLGVRNNQGHDFMGIRFTTEGLSPNASGQIAFNTTPSLQNSRKLVSISQCPGDFDRDAIMAETGCYRASNTQNLLWGGVNSTRTCKLEANKTYFLNIVYTESAVGTPSSEIEPSPTCLNPAAHPCGNLVTSNH
jgi:hypothetical protein